MLAYLMYVETAVSEKRNSFVLLVISERSNNVLLLPPSHPLEYLQKFSDFFAPIYSHPNFLLLVKRTTSNIFVQSHRHSCYLDPTIFIHAHAS